MGEHWMRYFRRHQRSKAYNPAKYAFSDNMFGFSVSYSLVSTSGRKTSTWLTRLVCWKISEMDAVAASLRYFSLGNIDFMNEYGEFITAQIPNEFAIDFTYSRKLIDQLSIANAPRFIYSNLTTGQYVGGEETKAGLAGAADLSLFY